MSYCYDVMSKVWAQLQEQLPTEVRDGELAMRFGFLLEEMHEANHRLKDAINHDSRVSKAARQLDEAVTKEKEKEKHHPECPARKGEPRCICDANYAFAKLTQSIG